MFVKLDELLIQIELSFNSIELNDPDPYIIQLPTVPPNDTMKLILSNRIEPVTLKYVFVSLIIISPNEERLVESFANLLTGDVYVIVSVDGIVVLSQIQTLKSFSVLRLFFIVLALSVLHGLDDVHVRESIPQYLTQQSSQLTSNKPIDDENIRSIMMIIEKFL
ncbi:MAG: hypothetical protein EZS28_001257 [Streblomastix strix]|uniref:Uncharacterized protein n=1 Tax=Streblomastix strix TaxID=222440 RepID=A0A5J4X7K0_9EUKA|nr:MAG: hypothetical protein EZS28_001257 [Streblomastix strix]